MKKLLLPILAAMLAALTPGTSSAVDLRVGGEWLMGFELGRHGGFTGGGDTTGYGRNGEDEFEPRQRLRLRLDAIASEALSGTVWFEIGDQVWGRNQHGAAMGADGAVVEVKGAFLDWAVPGMPMSVRMGIQPLALPGFTSGSQVFADDVAAVVLMASLSESVRLALFWGRAANDSYTGSPRRGHRDAGYLDNADMAGFALPVTLDGVEVIPWAMGAAMGPRVIDGRDGETNIHLPHAHAGIFPAAGPEKVKSLGSYIHAAWGGFTGKISLWDPWFFSWDFTWGGIRNEDNASMNRSGWLASLLVERALDWAKPGMYAWYGSGDDGSRSNGSERLPYIALEDAHNDFSSFAFNGNRRIARDGVVGESMSGTWGVGLRLKDISLVEDVKQTFRVNLIGGTNAPRMGRRLSALGLAANSGGMSGVPGMDSLYLTTRDLALEFAMSMGTRIYENMTVCLEASYVALWLDKDVWGRSRMNGRRDDVRDAWNVNFTYAYEF